MNTRSIAAEYRLSHWMQVIQERKASGLIIREYCRASGLRENVYFYWQRVSVKPNPHNVFSIQGLKLNRGDEYEASK